MPFGVTNGVACLQWTMSNFILEEELDNIFAFGNFILEEELDNIFAFMGNLTICGMIEKEHSINLEKFNEAAKCWNLNFNKDKCTFRTISLNCIGYNISQGEIKPDVERLTSKGPSHYSWLKILKASSWFVLILLEMD